MKSGGRIPWNVTVICEVFRKTLCGQRFGEPFKGKITPFGSMTECHPISAKDHSRLHQCDKKILLGIFVGYALIAVKLWKGDILEIHARRLHARFPKTDLKTINPNEVKSAKTTCVAGKPCDWSLSEPWTGFTQFT